MVAQSSEEVEFVFLAMRIQKVFWLNKFMGALHVILKDCVLIQMFDISIPEDN